MELITLFVNEVILDDSSEKIINILSIALMTITSLLILSILKSRKLKAKIKALEKTNMHNKKASKY